MLYKTYKIKSEFRNIYYKKKVFSFCLYYTISKKKGSHFTHCFRPCLLSRGFILMLVNFI